MTSQTSSGTLKISLKAEGHGVTAVSNPQDVIISRAKGLTVVVVATALKHGNGD
jgi:hypothetical protein